MLQKKLTQVSNNFNSEKLIYFLLLILSSFFFTFYYGFIGIFPLDSFLIYDAGYKIINGNHPFKDYWSITGPILDYIQFIFFKIFGVNWASYVLHATVINSLVTLTFFYFFLKIGIKTYLSFINSLSVSILAYPSAGTPFMDHHAVIFSIISVIFLILAFKEDKAVYWFLVPVFLFFSFLSKQIPSSYLLFIFLGLVIFKITYISPKNFKFIYPLFFGIFLSTLSLFLIFTINSIPWNNFFTQYFLYPLEIGSERKNNIIFNFNNVFSQFKFIYFSLIPLVFIIFKMFYYKKILEVKRDIILIIFVFFVIASFIIGQLMTKNQILIFFLIPFCIGITHYFSEKYTKNNLIKIFLISLLVFSTIKFHLRFNEGKKFMELNNVDLSLAVQAKDLDNSLIGLKWITPEYSKNPKKEINELLEIKKTILTDKTEKIIVSDYQILPSILNLKKIAPNKWFDYLSVPNKQNKYYQEYKDFFLQSLIRQNIETIYFSKNKGRLLINIFKQNCYSKENIEHNLVKLKIENCLKEIK